MEANPYGMSSTCKHDLLNLAYLLSKLYTIFMEEENANTQKGIKFDATFGQFMSALFIVFVLMILPIGGYEVLKSRLAPDQQQDVYTAQNLSEQGTQQEGRVAGVSTVTSLKNGTTVQTSANSDSVSSREGVVSTFEFLTGSESFFLIAGIALIAMAILIGGSYSYNQMQQTHKRNSNF